METINRKEVQQLIRDKGDKLVLVEVLSPEQYEKFHLPAAINVPINEDFPEKIQEAVPDKTTHVVVYCMDEDCDASPRAARKMDHLGYANVYDYEGGKKDWKAAGLRVETGA